MAIPDVKLIIECDGYKYHNRTHKMRKRDYFRDEILKFYGWKVIRLQGSEINRDVYDCVRYIEKIVIKRRERINKLLRKYEFYRFKK